MPCRYIAVTVHIALVCRVGTCFLNIPGQYKLLKHARLAHPLFLAIIWNYLINFWATVLHFVFDVFG